jgi:hypothetical protein
MKKLSLILFVASSLYATTFPYNPIDYVPMNSNGFGDTNVVLKFKADSTKYSKAFNLSSWENIRFDILAMDTNNSKTGFAGAAVKFYWWFETGHISWRADSAGKFDTIWTKLNPVIVDTFDMTTSGNMVKSVARLDSLGSYFNPTLTIDTLSVHGFAVQSRAITPLWDEFIRIGFKGLSGNITTSGKWVKLWVAQHRRGWLPIRSR